MTTGGVHGDRDYLLVDLVSGEIAAPEKIARWRPALSLEARTAAASVTISSADWSLEVSDIRLDEALHDHFGFRCGIREVGSVVHLDTGEVIIRPRYTASPLHIISTRSLSDLSNLLPTALLDPCRFRPNIVVDTQEDDREWIGSEISIGSFLGTVTEKTKRCGMTMIAQRDLPEDPDILRAIIRNYQRCLGVYADVRSGGCFSIAEAVSVG